MTSPCCECKENQMPQPESVFLPQSASCSLQGPPSMAEPIRYGIYIQQYFTLLQWERESQFSNGVKKTHLPLHWFQGVKGKLMFPRAYPRQGLQTAHFTTQQQLPAPQLSSKGYIVKPSPFTPPQFVPVMSPFKWQGGVAFPVPVSLTSPCPSFTWLPLIP